MAKLTHSALTMKPATFAAEAHKIGGRKNVGCESLTQVSQRMAKLQERLDGLAASMSGFIFTFRKDADGHTSFPFASTGVEEILGVTSEDIYDDAAVLRERIHPDDLLQFRKQIKESQRRLTRLCFEIRVNHPTQGQRWIEIRCNPHPQPDGAVEWHGLMTDVTDRNRLTDQLSQMFRAVEQSPVSIIITDKEGNIQYTNPKFTEVSGYSKEEAMGKKPSLLKAGDMDPNHYRELWTTLTSGHEWRGEFHNRKQNGERFWESALITPIFDKTGVITQYLAIEEDITARRQLEEQLRQTQKMEAIGQFATCVAHDFNNLLSVIILQTELVCTDNGLTQEVQEAMMEIRCSAERAAKLTGQLLLFGRKKVMQPHDFDLNDVIANFTRMLRRLLREDTHLKLLLHSYPLTIHADVGMLEQVLMNLAVNATDAMPRGGELLIETSEMIMDAAASSNTPDLKPGCYVCLSVSDTGTGIPPEVLPRIFDPFFTTKAVGKGTGLGLATVCGIVKQHGGSIAVSSVVGEGTRFQILFPACDGSRIQRPFVYSECRLPGGSECILVVEDQSAVRASLCRTLQRCGYQVLEAENGTQAYHLWKTHRHEVRLVLIDLIMSGGMSGHQLAQCLRADKPQLRILFTSGYSTSIANREELQIDGAEFVAKPFQSQLLLEAIRRLLDRRVACIVPSRRGRLLSPERAPAAPVSVGGGRGRAG